MINAECSEIKPNPQTESPISPQKSTAKHGKEIHLWQFSLTLFTMWVLIMNTKFAIAEPRHFEMQKYPQKENILKNKEFFTQDLNLGPQKLLCFHPTPYD